MVEGATPAPSPSPELGFTAIDTPPDAAPSSPLRAGVPYGSGAVGSGEDSVPEPSATERTTTVAKTQHLTVHRGARIHQIEEQLATCGTLCELCSSIRQDR